MEPGVLLCGHSWGALRWAENRTRERKPEEGGREGSPREGNPRKDRVGRGCGVSGERWKGPLGEGGRGRRSCAGSLGRLGCGERGAGRMEPGGGSEVARWVVGEAEIRTVSA